MIKDLIGTTFIKNAQKYNKKLEGMGVKFVSLEEN